MWKTDYGEKGGGGRKTVKCQCNNRAQVRENGSQGSGKKLSDSRSILQVEPLNVLMNYIWGLKSQISPKNLI